MNKDTRYISYEEGLTEYTKQSGQLSPKTEVFDSLPVVHRLYYLKFFLGKLLTQAEVLGLTDKQEKAYKDVIKSEFWSFVQAGFVVPQEIDEHLTPRLNELVDEENIMTEDEARAAGIDVDKVKEEAGHELLNI